jgi:hypothetical protein
MSQISWIDRQQDGRMELKVAEDGKALTDSLVFLSVRREKPSTSKDV